MQSMKRACLPTAEAGSSFKGTHILKYKGGAYAIEYSITRLLYVENAVGTYDPETGILRFSGEDDGGNVLKKAAIVNKGDCLEVTVTQSSHKDAVGSVQNFYKAADSEKS